VATVHFLNVGEGDCIVIQHNSGRISMGRNLTESQKPSGDFLDIFSSCTKTQTHDLFSGSLHWIWAVLNLQ
jgi:hypothetical protein